MLEALISLRLDHAADTATKKRGDVLVLALPDSPWSERERRECLLVEWDDPTLEAALLDRRAAGEAIPRICAPYERRDAEGEVTARSTDRLDVGKLPAGVRAHVLDPARRLEKLTKSSIESAGAFIRSKK